ncbi:MAG: TetR/AcrR family transcriptional regulator [Bdellovibrionota bacterium]
MLESARRLFESKGFLNTTLQDVAENAEISVGLIYRYFQSKEDIFAALALKGAKQFDKLLGQSTRKARQTKAEPVREVLQEIAAEFFDFYSVYGEYFDMLLYSYKGLKEVQIQASTLTRLMSVTLLSLNKIKNFMMSSEELDVQNEDDALRVVFVLWGVLLGMLSSLTVPVVVTWWHSAAKSLSARPSIR